MGDTTIRADAYNAINSLLVANKPTYTIGSTDYTYSIKSVFKTPVTLPIIILNPATIEVTNLATGKNVVSRWAKAEIEIEFFVKEEHGFKNVDVGRDSVMATILANESDLANKGFYLDEDVFEDSDVDTFLEGNQKINTAGMILRLHKK